MVNKKSTSIIKAGGPRGGYSGWILPKPSVTAGLANGKVSALEGSCPFFLQLAERRPQSSLAVKFSTVDWLFANAPCTG